MIIKLEDFANSNLLQTSDGEGTIMKELHTNHSLDLIKSYMKGLHQRSAGSIFLWKFHLFVAVNIPKNSKKEITCGPFLELLGGGRRTCWS